MKYLLNTNLKIAIDLNPRWWSFKFMKDADDPQRPNFRLYYVRLLPLVLMFVVDNGEFKNVEF